MDAARGVHERLRRGRRRVRHRRRGRRWKRRRNARAVRHDDSPVENALPAEQILRREGARPKNGHVQDRPRNMQGPSLKPYRFQTYSIFLTTNSIKLHLINLIFDIKNDGK